MDDLGGKNPYFWEHPYILKLALEEKVNKKTQFTEKQPKLAKAEIQKLFRIEFVKNPF